MVHHKCDTLHDAAWHCIFYNKHLYGPAEIKILDSILIQHFDSEGEITLVVVNAGVKQFQYC